VEGDVIFTECIFGGEVDDDGNDGDTVVFTGAFFGGIIMFGNSC